MYRTHTVGVVVPAYNEERPVGRVIEAIPPFVDRIYAVDDGSTDETWTEIGRAARSDDVEPPVVRIRHETNRGAGAAIKTGYRAALADGIDLVATIDADEQMDPTLLPAFLDPLVEDVTDYTKGNRLTSRRSCGRMPWPRLAGNAMLTALSWVASGYPGIRDPQNGYTAITRDALASLGVAALPDYYGYCNDVLVRLNAQGYRIADVTHSSEYGDEVSHIDYPTYVPRVSWILLRGYLRRLRWTYLDGTAHPLLGLYSLGVSTALVGALVAVTGPVPSIDRLPDVSPAAWIAAGCLLVAAAIGLDLVRHRGLVVET